MIFASDLDRTLIYTKKLIDENYYNQIVLVEKYLGKELSFMSKKTIEKLKLLNKKVLFIPVTTRTIEQYNRIFGISNEISPKYAITSNGGNILENGKISKEWSEIIKKKLKQITKASFIESQFLKSFSDKSWINKMVFRDDLFFSIHFDEISYESKIQLKKFEKWVENNNWHTSLQGKKLYIVPDEVNKWNALLYIKNKEKKQKIVSAGDSYLDYPLLINANYSICALHGELKKMIDEKKVNQYNIFIGKKSGIEGSEEMIDFVKNKLNVNI